MSQPPFLRTAPKPTLTPAEPAAPAAVRTFGPEIPAPFFVLLDLLSLIAAFLAAYFAAPEVKRLLLSGNRLPAAWISLLSRIDQRLSAAARSRLGAAGDDRGHLLCVQALGGYRRSCGSPHGSFDALVAPLVGVSTITLIVFTLKYELEPSVHLPLHRLERHRSSAPTACC
jgi:hypothetical protein